jgi:SAM-dependent methyltransferase
VPKETVNSSKEFYRTAYEQGFTTVFPGAEELNELLAREFKNSERDYSTYVEVLRAIGLKAGDSILDFGCSWGYGSWQLRRAGFDVFSYEVDPRRLDFARTRLGCQVVENELACGPVDCLFSAHVWEHLPDPNLLLETAARVLKADGTLIAFLPNGNAKLESVYGSKRYHRLWGQVHPLLIGPETAASIARRHGYTAFVYSSPYDVSSIRASISSQSEMGEELLLIARRCQRNERDPCQK